MDEDRLGPAEAFRQRRWSHAALVGVDHGGAEWRYLEMVGVCPPHALLCHCSRRQLTLSLTTSWKDLNS